ncbi:L-fucose:H+ symporter permease [Mucilaginibacter sp. RS28]|uniref:L-fucose:H+ symporter permease n=1 Tax=Mucilaginibacter straminoryzae TaxID=2932774 RepID=A0A9X2B7J8_9SPHI|nr:L-fucose:H+ symporter permease [Mucilaginibacter straminoryzae]MCJ8208411.1 L-fucose:H+ symporter permease [Mucilaginibacter straminoryzae]
MKKTTLPIILLTTLFFLWGFAHNLDPILIPHLKRSFTLSTVQATLVDSAVFIAYFIMALPAGFLIRKYGYKGGIITGLIIFAAGCFLFIPAANTQQYMFFLVALFIIACGLTTLETAANPYMTVIGDPETASTRLNFAQSFNGLATTLAPIIGAKVILTKTYSDNVLNAMTPVARKAALAAEASSVKMPYFILGVILVVIAICFYFSKLPVITHKADNDEKRSAHIFQVLRYKHVSWGVAAQFFYVGAQVCVFSLFILYATTSAKISEVQAAYYLSAGGFAFLTGRFIGTALMKFIAAEKLLCLYAAINVILCAGAIWCHGLVTVYIVIAICFFMSIMFPTIFALGIRDLGADTEFGSSLIIMSIVGGAIIPRFFGYLSDQTGNVQNGYFIPLACFVVVMLFGLTGHKVIRKAGIKELPVSNVY